MANAWQGRRQSLTFGILLLFGLAGAQGQAPRWTQQAEFAPDDSRGFGFLVALSGTGDTALVAPQGPNAECSEGVVPCKIANVFVLRSGSWIRVAPLELPPLMGNDSFNPSIALSGDGHSALVGLHNVDCESMFDCGAAYVLIRTGETWNVQGKLTPSDVVEGKFFGASVALSEDGSTALVGAPWDNCESGSECGAAYVFVRDGSIWRQEAKLTSSARAHREFFGIDVSLSSDGNTALIGASGNRRAGPQCDPFFCGAAYVFVRHGDTWSEEKKLTASDPRPNTPFGLAVSLAGNGNTAAIGDSSGAVYVFTRNGGDWIEEKKLAHLSAYFGFSVDLSEAGDFLLVGDIDPPCHLNRTGFDCGTAYLFLKQGGAWKEVQEVMGTVPAGSYSHFGQSVSLSDNGRVALVGSPEEGCNIPFVACGSAYIFGAPQPLEDIPTVSHLGFALLALLLAASGAWVLARRHRSA
jgi:hypothetical protein